MAIKDFFGKRGQAAITDSIYFLVIATSLSAFLFAYSTGYGQALDGSVERKELQEYTSSALKTILYTTIPRSATLPTSETDFLLASAKEDYFDDRSLFDTAPQLRNSVRNAMQPLAANNDYIFYFYTSPEDIASLSVPSGPSPVTFPFFLFFKTYIPPGTTTTVNGRPIMSISGAKRITYLCNPESINKVSALLFVITNKSRSSGHLKLLVPPLNYQKIEATLIVWPSSQIPDAVFNDLKCCDFDAPDFSTCAASFGILGIAPPAPSP